LDDEVKISPFDFIGRTNQAVDWTKDPSLGREDKKNGNNNSAEQKDVHSMPCRRGGGARPVVGIDHVLLIHLKDLVSLVLDLMKKRKELREILSPPVFERGCSIPDILQCSLVSNKKVPDTHRPFGFTRKGEVVQLELKRLFEDRYVCRDEILSLIDIPKKGEQGTAVHSFERLLHLLGCNNTPVVLAKDDVYGLPEGRKLYNAQNADHDDDKQQTARSE
jgi:hypothetical protein